MKGLNFIKGKSDPLAMEDHEYPDWLWRILEKKKSTEEAAMDADIYCMFSLKPAKTFPRLLIRRNLRLEDYTASQVFAKSLQLIRKHC